MSAAAEQEIPAIAFVFEASLQVAQEWRARRLYEYCSAIVKRIADPNMTKLRLAFVTYGTADTVPSPVLCKHFFTEHQIVFREMVEDISRLGVGMTNAGGKRGMAALEGLVAALELFDTLHTHRQGNSKSLSYTSHIIHIASAAPDASQHPSWNDSVVFDDVTWELLPGEMKKRNVQFSSINLRPNLSRYQELHAALATGDSTPWFNVRPAHTLLLASFTSPAPTKVMPAKRSNDTPTNTERTPDSKRMRIQPVTESPKPTQKAPTTVSQPAVAPNNQPIPPRPTQDAPAQAHQNPSITNSANINSIKFNNAQILERLQSATEQIQKLEKDIKNARAKGDIQLADALMTEYTNKKDLHMKFSHAIVQIQQGKLPEGQTQSQSQSQSQGQPQAPQQSHPPKEPFTAPLILNNGSNSLSTGSLPSAPSKLSLGSDREMATRSLSEMSVPTNQSPAMSHTQVMNGPANMQSQMQKLLDQQQRARPASLMSSGGSPMLGGIPINATAPRPDGPGMRFNAIAGPSQPSQQPTQQPTKQLIPVWTGSLNWSGQGSGGKKNIQTFIVATTSGKPAECHSDTWPKALQLVPTRETDVPMSELQLWLARHKPALCTLRVLPNAPDPKSNELNYQLLVQLLTAKKIYATAAWTTPSGGQTSNVLIFPVNRVGLAAAFFPLTGLPELPKGAPASQPRPNFPGDFPPSMLERIQSYPESQRHLFATIMAHPDLAQRFFQQRQQQQNPSQQSLQSQMPHNLDMSGSRPFNLNIPHGVNNSMNMAFMNMMNQSAQNPQNANAMMMAINAPQASVPAALPRMGLNNAGSAVPNLSTNFDMMQSFMSRNAENGMNMNSQG